MLFRVVQQLDNFGHVANLRRDGGGSGAAALAASLLTQYHCLSLRPFLAACEIRDEANAKSFAGSWEGGDEDVDVVHFVGDSVRDKIYIGH